MIYRAVTRLEEVVSEQVIEYGKVNSPDLAAQLFRDFGLGDSPVEIFVVALLDARHTVTSIHEVSKGILSSSLVHPREVFSPAIQLRAAAVIIAHNHPSGDTSPSQEDINVTKRLKEAGLLLGIPLLDHLIITMDDYRSII